MDKLVKIQDDGRVLIPAGFRKAMGIRPGDNLVLRLNQDKLEAYPLKQALKNAQLAIRDFIPEGKNLAEELIADRRKEAQNE